MDSEQELRDRLCRAAINIRNNAYAPYSGFLVGAALLGVDNVIYMGVNVENAAYPLGSCAEAGAISHMVYNGTKKIKAIAISGGLADSKENMDKVNQVMCTPCGGCRQKLREFSDQSLPIYICDDQTLQGVFTLGELLPHSFGPENL